MSRVGKMPVTIPAGVDVSIKEDQISVKGAGGTLATASSQLVKVNNDNGKMTFILRWVLAEQFCLANTFFKQ